MTRVLLAEDDPAISEPLARALRREDYDVTALADGAQALATARTESFDLIVLDLGLPSMDGLDVCRALRDSGSAVPVLILTARAEEVDAVVGLDAGADDYVIKPFRLAELLARARALLRRFAPEEEVAEAIRIDPSARRVWVDDDELQLTAKEFDLLAVLIREESRVVSREDLMREVWETAWFGATKTLDMHISVIRRKLGPYSGAISTVRGVGFRFDKPPS